MGPFSLNTKVSGGPLYLKLWTSKWPNQCPIQDLTDKIWYLCSSGDDFHIRLSEFGPRASGVRQQGRTLRSLCPHCLSLCP